MRNAALAALVLAIVVAAVVYVGVSRPDSSVVSTPTPTPNPDVSAPPSATASAPASTSPPTPSATSGALGAVTMQVTRTTVPAEFRYVVLGGGEEFRLVVLDLNAGRAAQVATARIALPSGAPTGPSAAVASSKEGRIDRSGGDPQIVGADTSVVGPAVGAEFRSARELFVWRSPNMFGGSSGVDLYDLATKRSTILYRPAAGIQLAAAAWRPNAAQYAIIERPESHVFVPLTAAWLR